jgi:23S rRNA-/tRNA-specific pseudouridylate synthase
MEGSITEPPAANVGSVKEAFVPEGRAGERLDRVLAELFADYSRTRLGDLARLGRVLVDDSVEMKN